MKKRARLGRTAAIGILSAAGASVPGLLVGCSAGGAAMARARDSGVGRAPSYLLDVRPIALRPMGADDGTREANPFADGGFDDMPPGWVGGGDLRPSEAFDDPFWKALDGMEFDVGAMLDEKARGPVWIDEPVWRDRSTIMYYRSASAR